MSEEEKINLKINVAAMHRSPFYDVFTKQDKLWQDVHSAYDRGEITLDDLAYCCFYIGIEFGSSYTDHVHREMLNTAMPSVQPPGTREGDVLNGGHSDDAHPPESVDPNEEKA